MKKVFWTMMLVASITCVQLGCSSDDDETAGSTWNGTTTYGTVSDALEDNNVRITWADSATVEIAGNLSTLVSATIKGGAVCILADASLADEVTYTLTGRSSSGSLYMDGDYKATFVLDGLTLQSTDSAAINIRDGKRIAIELADGTVNTLADKAGGSHKACLMVNGHTEFSGGGTLTLTGNTKHAFWGDEYVKFKKSAGTVSVSGAVADGFNVNQYFQMNGGTLDIQNAGDDGIAVATTDDSSDELNGQFLMEGGSISISCVAKGIKSEGDMTIGGGSISVTSTGRQEGCEGIESKGAITINGGYVYSYSYDDAINSKGNFVMNDGYVCALVQNANGANDAIDANQNIYINGGNIIASGGPQPENALDAAEGYNIHINGGNIFGIGGSTAQTSSSSKQASIAFSASVSGQKLGLFDASGNGLLYVEVPTTSCSAVYMTASGMTAGQSYTIRKGVSVSGGTTWNGLNTTGTVSGGTTLTTATSALQVGTSMGGPGGQPGGGGGPGGRW